MLGLFGARFGWFPWPGLSTSLPVQTWVWTPQYLRRAFEMNALKASRTISERVSGLDVISSWLILMNPVLQRLRSPFLFLAATIDARISSTLCIRGNAQAVWLCCTWDLGLQVAFLASTDPSHMPTSRHFRTSECPSSSNASPNARGEIFVRLSIVVVLHLLYLSYDVPDSTPQPDVQHTRWRLIRLPGFGRIPLFKLGN
ncbi:hypothetical protein R3P38DRAFT_3177964 [Favolaschia claudopus]|uniref:Uncharacterized protein n=1 Tax=Favolaschia claudopus TaxID=2862362 RepID=A0AAW0CY10_9AGAR